MKGMDKTKLSIACKVMLMAKEMVIAAKVIWG